MILWMKISKPEIEIITLVLNGKKEYFQDIYNRHVRSIFLVCMRYTKNKHEAEDLLQDSFVQIYRKLDLYDSRKGEFIYWAKKVAINTCLQHIRKNSIKYIISNTTEMIQLPNESILNIFDHLSLQELTLVIQQLPEGYRTIFNMFVVDGYTHKEISEKLNISINTSKSQLFKARKQLLSTLTQNGYEIKYG